MRDNGASVATTTPSHSPSKKGKATPGKPVKSTKNSKRRGGKEVEEKTAVETGGYVQRFTEKEVALSENSSSESDSNSDSTDVKKTIAKSTKELSQSKIKVTKRTKQTKQKNMTSKSGSQKNRQQKVESFSMDRTVYQGDKNEELLEQGISKGSSLIDTMNSMSNEPRKKRGRGKKMVDTSRQQSKTSRRTKRQTQEKVVDSEDSD